MILSKVKTSTICLLFVSTLIFVACKKETKISNKSNISLPRIEGFYIFKQNMSFTEVSNILTKNNLKFKIINKDNREELNSPVDFFHNLIFTDDFKYFKNIKLIEGYNLPILNKNLEKFQICFFNDSIFYFSYKNNTQSEYIQNVNNKENPSFRNKLKSNLNLLSTLSEGLNYKYGNPHFKIGDFDYPTSSNLAEDKWNDYNHKGKQFFEKEVWFSNDSIMHIELENLFIKDTFKINPPLIKTQLNTEIRVLFNSKYAKIIEDFSRKKDSIKEINKTKMEKKKLDSLQKEKNKQFKKL